MSENAWILDSYAQAYFQLAEAVKKASDNKLIQAGSIQYFEFCFELAWKSIKLISAEQGLPDCLSPKACLRQAFRQGWVGDEEIWLEMLDARNRMSHTYDADKALVIYKDLPEFAAALGGLLDKLRNV